MSRAGNAKNHGSLSRRGFLCGAAAVLPAIALSGRRASASIPEPGLMPVPIDLAFIGRQLPLLRRADWSPVLPKPWKLKLADIYDRITVHHAGAGPNYHTSKNAVARDMEGVLVSHIQRNYGDIGYHFVVDYSGTVWEGRSLAYEGAHVVAQNERNIGVMLLGNFDSQSPSLAQVTSLDRLVALLRDRFRVKPHRVFGHRDLGYSACPGVNLYAHVTRLRT
jgi:hypothetical protein